MKDITRYIESYIVTTQQSDLPPTFKSRVIGSLGYFKQQSLCDLDRRHPQIKLKENWLSFLTMLKGTSLTDLFRSEETAWNTIEVFVGIPTLNTNSKPKGENRKRFEGQEAQEILNHLIHNSSRIAVPRREEVLLVQIGLYHLQAEAMRGRGQRDKNRIRHTWTVIQPLLRKFGLLSEFDSNPEAVRKIKNFVSDKFL